MSTHCSNGDSITYARQSESQPLISPLSQPMSSNLFHGSLMRQLCVISRPIFLILLLTIVVGSVHFLLMGAVIGALIRIDALSNVDPSLPFVTVYFIAAIALVFYPVNGFLADICCGRRNVILISLCLIFCSSINLLLVVLLFDYYTHLTISLFVISLFVLVIAIIGIAGFGANFIQFGLDQLLEAPSHHHALFVHWAMWSYNCLSSIILVIVGLYYCRISSDGWIISISLIACCLLISTFFSCWKRHWFYTESRQNNPYRMVAKILKFATKHKYPLLRSAFTYCDDERPSRLDFAKERFGGPFTTEQVEDVKVFIRIVFVLLAVGPLFSVDPLINNLFFVFVGFHISMPT